MFGIPLESFAPVLKCFISLELSHESGRRAQLATIGCQPCTDSPQSFVNVPQGACFMLRSWQSASPHCIIALATARLTKSCLMCLLIPWAMQAGGGYSETGQGHTQMSWVQRPETPLIFLDKGKHFVIKFSGYGTDRVVS